MKEKYLDDLRKAGVQERTKSVSTSARGAEVARFGKSEPPS